MHTAPVTTSMISPSGAWTLANPSESAVGAVNALQFSSVKITSKARLATRVRVRRFIVLGSIAPARRAWRLSSHEPATRNGYNG